jgi:hypothetical protein
MTDDLVKRLRLQSDTSLMRLPENHIYVSHEEAADRIEQLERALHRIEENEDQFSMQWAAEIARAALEGKTE